MKIKEYLDSKNISYTLKADGLIEIHGDLNLASSAQKIDFSNVTTIGGTLDLRGYAHEFNYNQLKEAVK